MPPASSPRIAITGFGLVTPLGLSAWSTFRALLDGRTLTDRLAGWSPATTPEAQAAVVCAAGHVGRARHAAQDPAIDLAEIAAREALEMAGGESRGMPCFVGAGKGAAHALTRAADTTVNSRVAPGARPWSSSKDCENALPATLGPVGYLVHHLRQRLNLGPARGIVAACASSLTALHAARLHLLRNRGSGESGGRVLIVSSEAALLPMFIHSYRRLGVLPLSADPAAYRGRPLDRRRSGFILVEQAAAVVLERQDSPPAKQGNGQLALLDTAVASEGFDLVRPAPGMAALEHVARQLLAHGPIDLLHPHATGTPDNDEAEMGVYARILTDPQFQVSSFKSQESAETRRSPNLKPETWNLKLPDVYACKGAIGHGLGVSGLAALVLACLCARAGRRPPMPWLTEPIDSPLAPSRDARFARNANASSTQAVFAAGFGGHVAGAVIG